MPFNSLLTILLNGLLPGMDLDQGRELCQDVQQLVLLLLKPVPEFVLVQFQQLQLLDVVLFQLLYQTVIVVDCPLDLALDRLVVLQVRVSWVIQLSTKLAWVVFLLRPVRRFLLDRVQVLVQLHAVEPLLHLPRVLVVHYHSAFLKRYYRPARPNLRPALPPLLHQVVYLACMLLSHLLQWPLQPLNLLLFWLQRLPHT